MIKLTVSTDLDQLNSVNLEGNDYFYNLVWDGCYDVWHFTLLDSGLDPILQGIRVTNDIILSRYKDTRLPAGKLAFLTKRDGILSPPGINELGTDIDLWYISSELELDRNITTQDFVYIIGE